MKDLKTDKTIRLNELKELINNFCEKHLNEEFKGYAQKLCETLGRKRKIDIIRGKKEIWAASILYVIARLNFLFDKENKNNLTADIIVDFFEVKKSTIGTKATQIEKACNLGLGAEGYCTSEITDSFTYYKTPEGFILPKSMFRIEEVSFQDVNKNEQAMDGDEDEELDKIIDECLKEKGPEIAEKIVQKTEETKKKSSENKKKGYRQLSLFD